MNVLADMMTLRLYDMSHRLLLLIVFRSSYIIKIMSADEIIDQLQSLVSYLPTILFASIVNLAH